MSELTFSKVENEKAECLFDTDLDASKTSFSDTLKLQQEEILQMKARSLIEHCQCFISQCKTLNGRQLNLDQTFDKYLASINKKARQIIFNTHSLEIIIFLTFVIYKRRQLAEIQ
jgi:ABC-type Na+ transport system ATPase subunit NatA